MICQSSYLKGEGVDRLKPFPDRHFLEAIGDGNGAGQFAHVPFRISIGPHDGSTLVFPDAHANVAATVIDIGSIQA